jgi:uncharacterized repeat protein (TIGR03803 family)
VFSVRFDGTGYTVLKSFAGGPGDAASPYAELLLGTDGLLYGTTSAGGSGNHGTVFVLGTNGSGYAIVKSFLGGSDGADPYTAGVIEKNGALYGVTNDGGMLSAGTLFRLNKDGSGYTVLIHFGAGAGDGGVPVTTLIDGQDGYLYGTTYAGDPGGTIFRLRTD